MINDDTVPIADIVYNYIIIAQIYHVGCISISYFSHTQTALSCKAMPNLWFLSLQNVNPAVIC